MATKVKSRRVVRRAPGELDLRRIQRVILYVKDFDREVEFYSKTLGIPLKYKDEHWAEYSTRGITLCLHRGRETLPEGHEPEVCFFSRNFDATLEELRSRGIVLAPVENFSRSRFTYFKDPEGNSLGLEGK